MKLEAKNRPRKSRGSTVRWEPPAGRPEPSKFRPALEILIRDLRVPGAVAGPAVAAMKERLLRRLLRKELCRRGRDREHIRRVVPGQPDYCYRLDSNTRQAGRSRREWQVQGRRGIGKDRYRWEGHYDDDTEPPAT